MWDTTTNNKRLGNAFEQHMCELLRRGGFWVHFMSESKLGSQPFDILAASGAYAFAIECKTVREGAKSFPLSRLEENQRLAFDQWRKKTIFPAFIAIGRPEEDGWDVFITEYNNRAERVGLDSTSCLICDGELRPRDLILFWFHRGRDGEKNGEKNG